MAVILEDIRINGLDPASTNLFSGIYPTFSWDFIEDVESTTQSGFRIKIGSSSSSWGTDVFNGDVLDIEVDSSVPYYEYSDNNLSRGYVYFCQLKAWDNEYDGTNAQHHCGDWYSFKFTVNTLPYILSAAITPAVPTTIESLFLSYTYNDDTNQPETGSVIRWYNHNVLQEDLNDLLVVENRYLSTGDSWTAKITPFDGLEYGATYETSAVVVVASQTNLTDIEILPKDANIDDFLKLSYTLPDDPYIDLQNSTISYEWYVNGTKTSNDTQYVRLDLNVGDTVYAKIIIKNNDNLIAEETSSTLTILDSEWKIYEPTIGGLGEPIGLTELNPTIEWKRHKTKKSKDEFPNYLRVFITKTKSYENPIHDTGYIEYVKDSHKFSSDIFDRGKKYYVHIGAGDSQPIETYTSLEVNIAGSSWNESVENSVGWTIEFKAKLNNNSVGEKQGVYIHDGKYFSSLLFSIEEVNDGGQTRRVSRIAFVSSTTTYYDIVDPSPENAFYNFQTFRITGFGINANIYLNNKKVLTGTFGIPSLLKQIQFGDIDASELRVGTWKFVRYSTAGAYDITEGIGDDEFDFYSAGMISGGSIDCVLDDAVPVSSDRDDFTSSFLLGWTPESGSSKIIGYNENGEELTLPVATKNYSPITDIKLDNNQNKYVSSANGVTVLYGSKHDPDYEFDTDSTFSMSPDFDVITNLPAEIVARVQPTFSGSISIDTTHITLGEEMNPEWNGEVDIDPYKISHGIYYFSQRTHGQSWFDYADNEKGWQIEFTMNIGLIEQREADETNLDKEGVGFYINDGTNQEIITFTKEKVIFSFANVYADINTGYRRTYRVVGKGNNLKLYQRYSSSSAGTEQLLIDGTGLFTTPASPTANSRKPKIVIDSNGYYHCVWHDDGKKTSSIYYSKFDGISWSHPEIIIESAVFSIKNPDIVVNSNDTIFVVYEDLSYGNAEISCSIRDTVGWNPKIRLTNYASHKEGPKITVDHLDNIHVVWEDYRNGKPEIFWCYRNKQYEAWQSSAQFEKDENIVSQNQLDTNMTNEAMSFKNPSVCYVYPKVITVFEGDFNDGTSAIFLSSYDVLSKIWESSGFPIYSSPSTSSPGSSTLVSGLNRRCVNPDVAGQGNQVVVVWEDQTEPISQIWGNSIFASNNQEFSGATKITSRLYDCKNPSVGFDPVAGRSIIVFESQDWITSSSAGSPVSRDSAGIPDTPNIETSQIYADIYSAISGSFQGSATGFDDELIFIESEKISKHPSISKIFYTESTKVVYDFYKTLSENPLVDDEEHPPFWLIGSADVYLNVGLLSSTVETRGIEIVSSLQTKEFAFGDIDDNVGVQMSVRNLSMYFGYDAKPLSILHLNSTTIPDWPDNRVYESYVDVYGNVLAATYGGLVYYDIGLGKIEKIFLDPDNPEKTDFIVKAINYSKNGVWFIGSQDFAVFSIDGGQHWKKITYSGADITGTNSISTDVNGNGIFGTSSGIYVVEVDFEASTPENPQHKQPIFINNLTQYSSNVKVVGVDDSNIIWAGTEYGIVRIEKYTNKTVVGMKDGMRSNHVNDIVILDKGTRFVATATGIEKMTGLRFEHINLLDYDIASDNILSIAYSSTTKSLWFSSNNKLYEMVYKDLPHNKIVDEIVEYETEIGMEDLKDTLTHYILGLENLITPSGNTLEITEETTTVLINKNPIEFGYTIDPVSSAVIFESSPLETDQIDVLLSNKFSIFKDFAQNNIQKQVLGEKDTNIIKMLKTPNNQLIALSNLDNPAVMAYVGISNLPFALITLDREKPIGCLEKIEQLDRTTFKFKINASDQISGVTDMVLSNYENFTSDGTTAQSFVPYEQYATHNIGDSLNLVTTAFEIPSTATIDAINYNVGTGKLLSAIKPSGQEKTYVYAVTTKPVIVFRWDTTEDTWTAISAIENGDANVEAHSLIAINDILFLTTGSNSGSGRIYRTTNGRNFTLIGSGGNHIYCSAASDTGSIFFGDNLGRIYEYNMSVPSGGSSFSLRFSNIGDKVLSLEFSNGILYAATENEGTRGCGFQIDVSTGNVLTIFPQTSKIMDGIKIVNEDMFVVAGDSHEVWRSDYKTGEQLDFMKSYNCSSSTSVNLYKIPNDVLKDNFETT